MEESEHVLHADQGPEQFPGAASHNQGEKH
jgi:hypothetical protein